MAGVAAFGELFIRRVEGGRTLVVDRLAKLRHRSLGDGVDHAAERQALVLRPDPDHALECLLQLVQLIFGIDPVPLAARRARS